MIETIQERTAYPARGSFVFTPEGYAHVSYWMPENGYPSWSDFFTPRSYASIEEADNHVAQYYANAVGKMEIRKCTYWQDSLRELVPDRWTLAYSIGRAFTIVDEKEVPCYSQLKHTLYFRSVILGYGDGPIHKALPSKVAAKYIKEHCASSARLKAIALRAYESVANIRGYHTWTTATPPIFLCLAAAKSSLDAMSAVLWALLFRDTPTEGIIPDMRSLYIKLRKEQHPLCEDFERLCKSSWYTNLQGARNSVVHRSASPVIHDKFGAAFDFNLGLFKDMPIGKIHVAKPRTHVERGMKRLRLDKMIKGFIVGLEKWENGVAAKLRKNAWFSSFNKDGIMLGVDFHDFKLLSDGSGPTYMVTSRAQGTRFKYKFVGLHPFKAGAKPTSAPPPVSSQT